MNLALLMGCTSHPISFSCKRYQFYSFFLLLLSAQLVIGLFNVLHPTKLKALSFIGPPFVCAYLFPHLSMQSHCNSELSDVK